MKIRKYERSYNKNKKFIFILPKFSIQGTLK